MIVEALGVPRQHVVLVLDALRTRGETVATAESLTAGILSAALTDVPGASDVVRGGMVVYATDLKASLLGVDRVVLEEHGAVCPAVAEMLAVGVRTRCGADWGIGLTGVAGPDPQDGVSPGTVHLGFAGPSGATVRSVHLGGDRHAVRAAAVRVALEQFRELLR
ncbi:nicotinamide-nucleotide amidase [Saccharopolyspora erythraea NRRL 2338]|uniref:Competence-inducible (CinA-like) protein n=2 Tax=Saccharopolyspora erythraea TaxID=1836 RepID=A4FLY8_SACEN|nr:CinA family protein [Saccharopolyspora erythraea]EQD88208.1 competence protein [Saccharopolyspora erythraea D]PFG98702.1 nicotinamide-nucleotide amidase [Saccharopolyspora erythraea NRRL 2338]QRK88714.1 CinA family protein [Saccharopolyspora erythraea]CAM05063.1 competence-inducible (CinA-like) protein [Saccharopolyspora erythraea NRRL 2338]